MRTILLYIVIRLIIKDRTEVKNDNILIGIYVSRNTIGPGVGPDSDNRNVVVLESEEIK